MCGRYASARKRQDLLEEFRIERDRVDRRTASPITTSPRPSRSTRCSPAASAVPARTARTPPKRRRPGWPGGRAGQGVARELRVVRWGLVPFWAKDPSIGSRLINARVETVDSKPAFRRAFARRRCLLPADGFYEWQQVEQDGKARKQPYYIHRADGGALAFAGLYELWRDKSAARRPPAGLAVDHGDHHHHGAGRGRPDPRPDADGHRPRALGRTGSTPRTTTRRRSARCSRPRPWAG